MRRSSNVVGVAKKSLLFDDSFVVVQTPPSVAVLVAIGIVLFSFFIFYRVFPARGRRVQRRVDDAAANLQRR